MNQKLIITILATCVAGFCGELSAQAPKPSQMRVIEAWLQQELDGQRETDRTLQTEQPREQQVQRYERLLESRDSQSRNWETPDWQREFAEAQGWEYNWLFSDGGDRENWPPRLEQRYSQNQVRDGQLNEQGRIQTVRRRERLQEQRRISEQRVDGERIQRREVVIEQPQRRDNLVQGELRLDQTQRVIGTTEGIVIGASAVGQQDDQ